MEDDDGANMLLMLGELGANLADSGAVDGDDSDEDESYSKVGHDAVFAPVLSLVPTRVPLFSG